MSYSRFGCDGSDVYVYLDAGGYLLCCMCPLQAVEWVVDSERILGGYLRNVGTIVRTQFTTTAAMLEHLDEHRAAGHTVPECTYEQLRDDAADNDAWIASGAPL